MIMLPKDSFALGVNTGTGRPLVFSLDKLTGGIVFYGKPGSGKTTALQSVMTVMQAEDTSAMFFVYGDRSEFPVMETDPADDPGIVETVYGYYLRRKASRHEKTYFFLLVDGLETLPEPFIHMIEQMLSDGPEYRIWVIGTTAEWLHTRMFSHVFYQPDDAGPGMFSINDGLHEINVKFLTNPLTLCDI